MSGTLICTVGGTPEPIAFSLANFSQPDRVIFISSQGSTTVIDDALSLNGRLGFALDASRISRIELSDPQNIHTCVREMEQTLNNLVAQTNSPQDPLVVDVTGGTKPMSAALMLVARRWDCQFRYVGGAHRSKEGLGVVSTGTEFLSECTNPMDELGYAAVEDALALANRASYSAARDVLKQAQSRVSGEDAKRALRALEFVVHLFALRDRFQFRQALGQLHNLHHHHSLLNAVIDRRTAELVLEAEPAWRAQLETLSNNCVSTELIAELLANADRRFKEERFDDGVARLYRATEAIAQFALSKSHGIPRTSRVPAERLPGALREEFGPRIKNGTVSLGLQDDYRLLSAVADPLGECFTRLGLEDRRSSLLETRNQSILAHGFQPVTQKALSLRDHVMQLAAVVGISEADLPRFPTLCGRGTRMWDQRPESMRSNC